MTALNDMAERFSRMRRMRDDYLGIAVRRNATLAKNPNSHVRDRQRHVIREALVVAATFSVALGEHESVGDALIALADEHGIKNAAWPGR